MKEEPEWVDVVAMFALLGILSNTKNNTFPHEFAFSAYEIAEAMIEERNERRKRNG